MKMNITNNIIGALFFLLTFIIAVMGTVFLFFMFLEGILDKMKAIKNRSEETKNE